MSLLGPTSDHKRPDRSDIELKQSREANLDDSNPFQYHCKHCIFLDKYNREEAAEAWAINRLALRMACFQELQHHLSFLQRKGVSKEDWASMVVLA